MIKIPNFVLFVSFVSFVVNTVLVPLVAASPR